MIDKGAHFAVSSVGGVESDCEKDNQRNPTTAKP